MELSEIEQRLKALEDRLSLLEKAENKTPFLKTEAQVISRQAVSAPSTPARSSVQNPAADVSGIEKPANWLGIIAVICFVLAAGFIIKLSIESGWLTPVRQIGLAVAFGISLIGAGFSLLKSDREYSSFLPAAGVIVLYLSAYASYRLYGLLLFEGAIAVVTLVSALCIWLYLKLKHDIYAFTAAIGSYLAPIILGVSAESSFSFFYFLWCSFAFATISVWLQSRALTFVAAYLAILMTGFLGAKLNLDGIVAIFLGLNFIVFGTGLYFYTHLTKKPLTETESFLLFPVLLIFYAMEYYFINRLQPGLAPWISLFFASLMMGFYLAAKKRFPNQNLHSASVVFLCVTLICFHSVYLELLPADFRPWLFSMIILAFAFSPLNSLGPKGTPLRIPILALGLIVAIEYISMLFKLMTHPDASILACSMTSLVVLWVLQIFKRDKLNAQTDFGLLTLLASHALAVLGFYQLLEDFGSLAVSAAWLFYAVAVISFAFMRKDKSMAKSALLVLGLAAGKALLYDTSSAETVVRILCLLMTGAVLYGAGLLMRKISSWDT